MRTDRSRPSRPVASRAAYSLGRRPVLRYLVGIPGTGYASAARLDEIGFADAEGRVTETAQRQLLQLTDPLPREVELVPDLLECAGDAVVEAVAEGEDPSLALGETLDGLTEGVGDVHLLGELNRVGGILVLDEVTELGAVLADRLLERDRVGDAQRRLHLVHGDTRLLGDLVGAGVAAQFRLERCLGGANRGERVVEMDRDAHGAGLVGDGAGDGLADPPGGVGGELEALAPVELLDGADQTQVALLDQVEEVDPRGVGVTAGVGDHQTKVGREEVVLGLRTPAGLATELHLLALVGEVALLEPLRGLLTGLDLLRQLDLLLRREQVVLADRSQVLRDEIGSETTPLVGQLRLKPNPARLV